MYAILRSEPATRPRCRLFHVLQSSKCPKCVQRLVLYYICMKYLGIDYGSRIIGLSISDEGGRIAFPKTVLANDHLAVAHISKMVSNEGIGIIVVGDARTLSGAPNPVTRERDEFVAHLAAAVPVPVESIFEGWSSIEADRFVQKNKGHDDSAAAAVILQRYIDMRGKI